MGALLLGCFSVSAAAPAQTFEKKNYNYSEWTKGRFSEAVTLIGPGKMTFTWVQDQFPDWLAAQLCGPGGVPTFPTGPHPEQIRILTYLGLAAGCRGLGFWSDKALFAADPASTDCLHGRERLLEAALLNSEIEMLLLVTGCGW